jgi:hypothetical protein
MALVFRSMYAEGQFPRCGPDAKSLGVRVPPSDRIDIEPDSQGHVLPQSGGMSVSSAPKHLPVHRLPRRLKDQFPDASGSNEYIIWHMGEGIFTTSTLTEQLMLRTDHGTSPTHGFVEPVVRMPCPDYQTALAATRELWGRWGG